MDFPANKPSSYGSSYGGFPVTIRSSWYPATPPAFLRPITLQFFPAVSVKKTTPGLIKARTWSTPQSKLVILMCFVLDLFILWGTKKGGEWATRSAHPMNDLIKDVDAPRWALNGQGKSTKHLKRCHVWLRPKKINGIQPIASTEESNRVEAY